MTINLSKLFLLGILTLTPLILLTGTGAEAASSQSFNLGGLSLTANQSVSVGSGSSAATLIMQSDGNFVVYKNSGAAWASGSNDGKCSSGCKATFQSDGNLVVYGNGEPIWASGTHGKSAATLVFQDVAPYLQITNSTGATIWQSSGSAPGPATQSNSVAPGPWPGDLNILDYGAVGDGVTDNSIAIQKALNDAKTNVLKGSKSGVGVFVPPGKFAYKGVMTVDGVNFKGGLTVDGVRLDGAGNASELIALDPNNEPIILVGNGTIVANLYLHIDYTGKRLTGHYNQPIYINQATNFQVDHIYIDNSASGGIGDTQGSFGKVTNNTILNTCADSISNYEGVHDVLVDSNYIENSGDDGISVYSLYSSDPENGKQPYNYNIIISNNAIINNRWGRNISVVGGENITYKNNYANGNNNNLACMYFAAEPSKDLQTLGAKDVTATNNTIMNCGDPKQGYAALTIAGYNGAKDTNDNITVQNTIIEPGDNSSGNPNHDIGVYGPLSYNISLENIEELGKSINSLGGAGQVVKYTTWPSAPTSGPVSNPVSKQVGYTPAPAGVSGTIPVVSGPIPIVHPATCGSSPQ